jgi:CubicO group peptidase (beta-lactamase class C family)
MHIPDRIESRLSVTGTIVLPVIAALLAGMTAASAQQKPTIAGDYTATLDPSFTLRLHLKLSADSVVTGSIDIPDEFEAGDALTNIRFDGHTLRFSVAGHTGFWEGIFAVDGNSLNGKWSEEGYLTPELFIRDTPPLQAAKPSPVDGIWLGTLPAGNAPVRIQLIVKSDPTGRISCTMDSPDQRVMGMRCAHVLLSGDSFSFDIPVVSAQFSGKLAEDGKTLTGTLTKDAATPLIFQRQSAALPATAKPAPTYDAALPPVDATGLQSVLDRDLAEQLKSGMLMPATGVGVSIGVVVHGVERLLSYGAAKPDSIFEIGSTTKTFTGLMLAQMVAQGEAKLDEPVRDLLPPGTAVKPVGAEITLLDLVTRRSGLPRLPSNIRVIDAQNPYADYHTADLYAFLSKNGVARIPPDGSSPPFSDLGFGLLGHALANRAGISYSDLLKEEIANPLGLQDTTISLSPAQELRFLHGTNGVDHRRAHPLDFDAMAGAGAIRSTAGDMLAYLEANLHPENLKPAANSKAASTLSEALTLSHQLQGGEIRPGMRIALAWLYQTNTGNYWHDGATAGFSSYVFFNPQSDYAAVVLLNAAPQVEDSLVDRLGEHIGERLAGKPAISLAP